MVVFRISGSSQKLTQIIHFNDKKLEGVVNALSDSVRLEKFLTLKSWTRFHLSELYWG